MSITTSRLYFSLEKEKKEKGKKIVVEHDRVYCTAVFPESRISLTGIEYVLKRKLFSELKISGKSFIH